MSWLMLMSLGAAPPAAIPTERATELRRLHALIDGANTRWKAGQHEQAVAGSRREIGVTILVEGPPKAGGHGTEADWHRSILVGTYRCSGCGFLESYARPEFRHQEGSP